METFKKLTIGVDASRNRSGGARAHLIGIISELDPNAFGIKEMHVWSFPELLNSIPARSWLIKHEVPALNSGLISQLLWQKFQLKKELKATGCDVLFSTIASTLCRFKPMAVLSQDLLSYEPGIMNLFGYTVARLRLVALLIIQNLAFKRAGGVIFLTKHAAKVIQESCGKLKNISCIPHGVNSIFNAEKINEHWPETDKTPIRCLYISPTMEYKHQCEVAKAIKILTQKNYNITLQLIGGGGGKTKLLLDQQIKIDDPEENIFEQIDFIPIHELPDYFSKTDIFIFASSCEAFGISLLEGMSFGLPIACSNRSCLPELLKDGGVYFDPENPNDIARAVEQIIENPDLRQKIAGTAKELSKQYSWKRCSNETWEFVVNTYFKTRQLSFKQTPSNAQDKFE